MEPVLNSLVPIVSILAFATVIAAGLWLSYKAKADHHETVRRALELGQTLDGESMKMITSREVSPAMDRRAGVIALCVGIAFFLMAAIEFGRGGHDDLVSFAGIVGLVFAGVGAGRLIAWKLAQADSPRRSDTAG
jgi:hypothetical protein